MKKKTSTVRTPTGAHLRARVGADLDLSAEVVRDRHGRRVTERRIEEIVAEVKRVGRPSLAGSAAHSPRVSFRVPADVRARAEHLAAKTGKSLSTLARDAFEDALRRAR
jgi:predicted HicB family RNase H-like nuclease